MTGVFVSYAGADRPWALWVGRELEAAGFDVELADWEWSAGDNFVLRMSDALERSDTVVALWSKSYFERRSFATDEWTAVMAERPDESGGHRLVPVRVAACTPPAVLRSLTYADVFGLPEREARAALLAALGRPAAHDGAFPGDADVARVPGSLPEVWNLPHRNPAFTGRETLLASLREQLESGGSSWVQALNGMGGVGKTQLAIEYAHLFANDYDLAWWIDAEQPDLIPEQIAALAIDAGWVAPGSDTTTARREVERRLRGRTRWLLIFDNVTTPQDVHDVLPQGPGHVILTTRHRGFTRTPLTVKEFSRPESIALLRSHVPTLAEADALAEALGDLPLALAQAAGLLVETGMSATDYTTEISARARDLFAANRVMDYPVPLAAAIELSMQRLGDRDPAAAGLMSLCSFLAPDPIPIAWFRELDQDVVEQVLAQVVATPLALYRTVGRLAEFGLARIDDDTIQLHRLTQAVIRDTRSLDDQAALRSAAARLLTKSKPSRFDDPTEWPAWAALLPHVLALDPNIPPDNASEFTDTADDGLWYLMELGEFRTALGLAKRWHASWTADCDPDDLLAMTITHTLGYAYSQLGFLDEALRLNRENYERRRRVLGEDDQFTLSSAHNLAIALSLARQFDDALALNQATYERRLEVLGAEHLESLLSANSVAVDLSRVGQWDEALVLDREIYERRLRLLGPDHPDTLQSANNLAVDLGAVGRGEESLALHEDTYRRQRRVLGEEHPQTRQSARNIAGGLQDARQAEAQGFERRADGSGSEGVEG